MQYYWNAQQLPSLCRQAQCSCIPVRSLSLSFLPINHSVVNYLLPLPMHFKNMFRNLQTPMQQRLSNHWTYPCILRSCTRSNNLITQLTTKPSFHTCTLHPTTNLTCIIGRSSTGIETTIPLEPTVRITVRDPSTGFPHAEGSTTFDTIFVDLGTICGGG